MCSKTVRVRKILHQHGPDVAKVVGEFFGQSFSKLVDDMVAGKEPVRFRYPDREGNFCFGYTQADAMRAAQAANSSY